MLRRTHSGRVGPGGLASHRPLHAALSGSLGLILLWGGLSGRALLAEPIGQIKTVQGTVMLTRLTLTRPAVVGDLLETGDRLTTGAASRISMTLIDASRFALGSHTSLLLVQFTWREGLPSRVVQTHLSQGQLVVSTGGPAPVTPGTLHVTTPRTTIDVGAKPVAIAIETRRTPHDHPTRQRTTPGRHP